MVNAISGLGNGGVQPLLVYFDRKGLNLKASESLIFSGGEYQKIFKKDDDLNIFAAIQGREQDSFTFNPFKVLLKTSPYLQYKEQDESNPNILAGLYLQYPNSKLKSLAMAIVSPGDSNDAKVAKITAWVINNISYVEDKENYGAEELWAAPVMTLAKRSGDCEDGAFLIHSLALNAGVPADRLRTYGGEVKSGVGAASDSAVAGHGWTAYRRESDNEWVVLDFSYYPTAAATEHRMLMKDDSRYLDDYFYMTLTEFVTTNYSNRIRDPDGYDYMGRVKQNLWVGNLVDTFI